MHAILLIIIRIVKGIFNRRGGIDGMDLPSELKKLANETTHPEKVEEYRSAAAEIEATRFFVDICTFDDSSIMVQKIYLNYAVAYMKGLAILD